MSGEKFNLTPEECEQLVGNQRITLIASRAHWAMTYLAQAGLTDRPRRGAWCITDEGRRLLATGPKRIDNTVLAQYEGFQSVIKRSAGEPDVDEAETLESGGDTVEAAVGMPSVDDLLRPMLEALSDGKPHAFADLVDNPNARVVALTAAGRSFLASHPGPVDMDTLKRDCPPFLNWLADMGAIPAVERRDRGEPTVWMVRAGEGGVHAPVFVRVAATWPEYGRRLLGQVANGLYKFAHDMQPGDVVVTPEPASRTVLLGEVTGAYYYLTPPTVAGYSQARPVTWRARISRDELGSPQRIRTLARPSGRGERRYRPGARAAIALPRSSSGRRPGLIQILMPAILAGSNTGNGAADP